MTIEMNNLTTKTLSIVIPVLNEEKNIPELVKKLEELEAKFAEEKVNIQYIFNNNASSDKSEKLISDWSLARTNVILQSFSYTIPFQNSIMRGLKSASGDVVAVLQSDLQDPPELLLDMFSLWRSGSKVVAAIATNKHSSVIQTVLRNLYYRILTSGASKKILHGFQDFYVIDRSVANAISSRNENFQFIRGYLSSEFGVDSVVRYQRMNRTRGESKFRFAAKYDLALDGLLVYSTKFIRGLAIFGLLLAALSFLATILGIVLAYLGIFSGTPGWASLILVSTLGFGLIMAFFAFCFEFLSRILRILIQN